MFEDGARLDDIINILGKPKSDAGNNKDRPIPEAAIRYETKRDFGEVSIKFDFAGQKNLEVLR